MIIVGLSLLARSATSGPNDSDLVPASSCNDRSIYNIVWSCLTTIFACTWLAVHPNVPLVGERLFVRRLKICGLALVAPELIVLWAIRQWFSSRRLALKYKDFGWTQAHGFFAIMGGFQVRQENGELLRVPFDQLESLLHNGDIQITEREILDKSKGDALAKALVLFQVTWFLLQALARANQHLPVTELEVVTLAFAFLNFMTYFCWWNKPLDVDFPVLITTDIPCPPDPLQTDEPQATDPDSQTSYRSRSRTQPMAMSDAQTSQGIRAQNPTPNAIISDGQPISLLQKTSLANHTPNPEHDVPAVTATSVLPLPPQVTVFVLRFKNDDSNRRQSTGCLDEHHFHQGDLRRQLLKSPFSKSCPAIVSPGFLLQSTLEDDDSSHEEKSHHVGTFVHPLPPEPASLTSRLSPANGEIWLQNTSPSATSLCLATTSKPLQPWRSIHWWGCLLRTTASFVLSGVGHILSETHRIFNFNLLKEFRAMGLRQTLWGQIARYPKSENDDPYIYGPLAEKEQNASECLACVAAVLFGVIHCLVWHFKLPSQIELFVWRASSVIISCLPIYIMVLTRITFSVHVRMQVPLMVTLGIGTHLYILGRSFLMVDMFVALRNPSAGIYSPVNWVSYIPHV